MRVISIIAGLMMDACCLVSLEDWALRRGIQRERIKRRNTEARGDTLVDIFQRTKRLRLDLERFFQVPGWEKKGGGGV